MTSKIDDALKEGVKRILPHFPIAEEERIETLSAPVVIESACPGWQPAADFAAVPCSIEAQVGEITDSFRAGAVGVHVHPRDPKDCSNPRGVELLVEILDGVFGNVGDFVALQHSWDVDPKTMEVDYIHETEQLLQIGNGNKYCQGTVVLPYNRIGMSGGLFTEKRTWQGVEYMYEHNVKPMFQLYDTYAHFELFQAGVRTGRIKDSRPILNLHLGKHHSHTIHKDPWSHLQLITNYHMVKETLPGSIVGVYPGGRNWLPILITGLLLGAPLIRVGIEDCYWMWPHRDEVIQKNSDVVKMAVDLCRILGRRVVTDPSEARDILGIELTSSNELQTAGA